MFEVNASSAPRDAGMPMIRWRAFYVLLVLALACAVLTIGPNTRADAQSTEATEPTREQLQTQIDILKDRIKQSEDLSRRLEATGAIDPELLKAYTETQIQQYELLKKQSEYTSAILEWNIRSLERQRFAYGAILFLVALVVVAGTAFSGFQLWASSVTGVQANSDLEVSASKIRVTSSVVGLIVLMISLLFLYIYTQQIYQVQVVDTDKILSNAKPSK